MTQIFIVSGTTWTVSSDWNASSNTIETIGGGGGGQTADASFAGSGGGGGAYSKISNILLTSGNIVAIQVGTGGSAGQAGGDTWFNGASLTASSVGAKGGGGGADNSGGAGGDAGSGVGTTKFSGGNGGTNNSAPYAASGGGGGAGPNGNGSTGGSSSADGEIFAGGGGGGGNGGGSSTAGSAPSGNVGGDGGAASDGTAGGLGTSGSPGGGGAHGSGGGGAGPNGTTLQAAGVGGTGVEFDGVHGSGGGGAGGSGPGQDGTAGANGANGGNYGGGGGGGGWGSSLKATGGDGADGIIVITYTAATSTPVTADAWTTLEFQETLRADDFGEVEFVVPAQSYTSLPIELLLGIQRDATGTIEFSHVARSYPATSAEWTGTLAITADGLAPVEFAILQRSDTITLTEFRAGTLRDANNSAAWPVLQRIDCGMAAEQLTAERVDFFLPSEVADRCTADARFCVEWLRALAEEVRAPIEMAAVLRGDVPLVLEWLTSGALVSADMMLSLEFADPPQLVLVSLQRVLRSPGKIRILAAPGSTHPLRGQ